MRFGINVFATDTTLQPVELARAVEERGFESMWLPEHSHIPTSRATPWGGVRGAQPLPEKYWRTHDTFIALAAAAAVTTTLKLATGITLLAQRDPVWTAKEVASLDVISNGRVILGVGYGWNREEMDTHSLAYEDRREVLREHLLVMKSLWTDEVASFDGDHFHLAPSWSWPKPVQRPHPPVILGAGLGPRTLRDLVELCDGWIPLGRHTLDTSKVKEALTNAGRNPDEFDFTYFGAKPDHASVERLEAAGMGRVTFGIESGSSSEVITQLDACARIAGDFR